VSESGRTLRLDADWLIAFAGRSYQITYETPKSESLQLFYLGERTYDHIIFFPTKIKGARKTGEPDNLL
jgi:hypothetical protein